MSDIVLAFDRELVPAKLYFEGEMETVLVEIERDARASPIDISTQKGRDACASLAALISKRKTYLDNMGKDLGEEWRVKVQNINTIRKTARDRLDRLKDEIRLPLTEWEDRKKRREDMFESLLSKLGTLATFSGQPKVIEVEARLVEFNNLRGRNDWDEYQQRADKLLKEIGDSLDAWLTAARNNEAQAAQLAIEKAERAKKEQEEREARIAQAAAERTARIAAEKAEEERRQHASALEIAEKRARAAEAAQAQAVKDAERRREEAITEERRRAQAERDRLERDRLKKAADRRHQESIHNDAIFDICEHLKLTTEQAREYVLIVAAGRVRNMKVIY
jgi:hypothetical protein